MSMTPGKCCGEPECHLGGLPLWSDIRHCVSETEELGKAFGSLKKQAGDPCGDKGSSTSCLYVSRIIAGILVWSPKETTLSL